jgi:hypothetical protein
LICPRWVEEQSGPQITQSPLRQQTGVPTTNFTRHIAIYLLRTTTSLQRLSSVAATWLSGDKRLLD